jgi:poly-beta-1,6-N-acetyl-D-glucosamine synthase
LSLELAADILLVFVALYPVVTAAAWIAGGLLFRVCDEHNDGVMPEGGWPGVTVLVSAYNEELVIGEFVRALRAVDYPELEVLVLDDGSTDSTAREAEETAAGDRRITVVRDPVNRGKAERLNIGLRRARHELVAVTDADTHLHPEALKLLVSRLLRSERVVAVAAAPHVTNRRNLLEAMQILEAASIIGLIRRTQAVAGRVGTVAGVLGLFRRDPVLGAGGYRGEMATEDIDLSWRLLLQGWHTTYEPNALVGMQVPPTLGALWAQRKRWARGQGEVLHAWSREVLQWRNRDMWPLAIEAFASLVWITTLSVAVVLVTLASLLGRSPRAFGFGLGWGVAIAVVGLVQMSFALGVARRYDRFAPLAFVLAPVYPLAYWLISAMAALRAETPALIRGPSKERVVWDVPREPLAR